MTLTAAEQYLLELINRARLDPAGEAARMGVDLNDGLSAGQISTSAKQVLAPNALLEAAATGHTQWMLSADVFSHTGLNGSSPGDRISAQGYAWSTYGENCAYVGSSGTMTVEGSIEALNRNLFLSAGHRANMLYESFREVGLGAEAGQFTSGGRTYNAVMLTEDFGTSGSAHFLTGVAYADSNADQFYSMGEGTANVTFSAGGLSTQTAAAGGYALAIDALGAVNVTGQSGSMAFSVKVDMTPGNVKLDLVSGTTFYTSGTVWLGQGVNNVLLLGVGALQATGNAAANVVTGNAAANFLYGLGGSDQLLGGAGADRLFGGGGNDSLTGGLGNDALRGYTGSDVFVFTKGSGLDRIFDFSVAQLDRLQLDDALWAGQTLTPGAVVAGFATVLSNRVVLDFGDGDSLQLVGLTGLAGLESLIDIV